MRQHFGDRKHGFIFQIMENGTKEKEELGAAYLQENFDEIKVNSKGLEEKDFEAVEAEMFN